MNPNDWIVCPHCGSEDAYYIDWRPDNDLTLKCPDCGEAEYEGAYWQGEKSEYIW